MNVKTRSMSKKQEMTATADSKKLDNLLTKMDTLLEAKNDMLMKLNKLEEIQHGIVKDVNKLKQSLQDSQQKIEEKADGIETAVLMRRIEDLENQSKCNNIIIWGMEEGSEGAYTSMEEFISVTIFQGLMILEREVEVMRAHGTNIKQNAYNPPKPRPIQVYLLR